MPRTTSKPPTTRGHLGNPFPKETRYRRLVESEATDLRNNALYTDLNNGYIDISPIDPNKKFQAKTPSQK